MWRPIKIWAENVGAISSTEYSFENGCTLVQGINNDDDGQESNGGGKSSFIDIPALAILGESLLGKSPKDIVNWDDSIDSMIVGIELDNKKTKQTLTIQRDISKKTSRSEILYIWVNGEVPKEVPSKKGIKDAVDVREGNKYILSLLDITKENLLQRYLISGDGYSSFFQLTGGKKLQLVEQFANVDAINSAAERCSIRVDRFNNLINEQETDNIKLQASLETTVEFLENIKNGEGSEEFEILRKQRIQTKQEKIEFYDEKKLVAENEMLEVSKNIALYKELRDAAEEEHKSLKENKELIELELSNAKREIKVNPHQSKIDEIALDAEANNEAILIQRKIVEDVKRQIKDLELQLDHTTTCPNCSHEFSIDAKSSVEEIQNSLDATKHLLQTEVKELSDLQTDQSKIVKASAAIIDKSNAWKAEMEEGIDEIQTLLDDINDEIRTAQKTIDGHQLKADQNSNKIIRLDQDIESFEASQKSLLEDIEDIKEEKFDPGNIETYEKQKKSLERDIEEVMRTISILSERRDRYSQWMLNFEDFKFHVIHKRINSIAARINYYLKNNNSDLSVIIEGFKENRSGEKRQEFTPMILRNGYNPQKYSQFSGGERTRLNLAADLAFQEIVNSTSASGGLAYYQNDELLNPVDTLGIANAAKAFDNLPQPILLVTHSGTELNYKKKVIVEKTNGKSVVK